MGWEEYLSLCLPDYFLFESFLPSGSSHSDVNAFAWVRIEQGQESRGRGWICYFWHQC